MIKGDIVKISTHELNIINIDYDSNLITVDQNISWLKGEKVFLNYSDKAPDLGVFESGMLIVIGVDINLTK